MYAKLYVDRSLQTLIERTHPSYDQWQSIERKLFEPDNPGNPIRWFLHPEFTRQWMEGLISKVAQNSNIKAGFLYKNYNSDLDYLLF